MDVYGLIGNPVGHSLSPPMHNAGFATLGIDAHYVTFEPEPGAARSAVTAAETLGISGLNVTIPFKEDVMTVVDPDDVATEIGAINTVDFTDEEPTGHNTDVEGAMRALTHHNVSPSGHDAVVVGAGGAARAIVFGLVDAGASVAIANRTAKRAHDLADEFGASGHGLEVLPDLLSDADLLINATSVGMGTTESIVPEAALHGDLVVMDAVYRPLETRLLKDADEVGARTIDGAWMLLFQGTAAFERWTGKDAPVSAMNDALRSAL